MIRRMSSPALSPARRALIAKMRVIWFGSIRDLQIVDGQPILDPVPTIVREWKFASQNEPTSYLADAMHKPQIADLLQLFDRIGNGTITVLQVRHGLPFHCEMPG